MAVGPYGALLEAVRGVRWAARRAVPGGAPGAHLARTRAVASEFVEYRPYRQGDDPRGLDWKLLARSDRAFTRLAPDRSVLGTTIVLDASASMAFPPLTMAKWVMARQVTVAAAAVVHAEGDPVGLAVAGREGVARLAARTRRGVVAEIARTIDAIVPAGSTSLLDAFTGARARVLVVTDCLGDAEGLSAAARAHVAAGGEAHVVHIVARGELDPVRSAILATDPEDAAVARPLTATTRAEYVAAFDAWRAGLSRALRDGGVSYHEVVDDEAPEVVMRRLTASPAAIRMRA